MKLKVFSKMFIFGIIGIIFFFYLFSLQALTVTVYIRLT